MNFTTAQASSNSSTHSTGRMDSLNICVLCVNLIVGLPTHSYIIWLIITGSGVASEFFILNVAVCDIATCVNSLLVILDNHVVIPPLMTLIQFMVGFVITGRPLFQCLMCVERYLAVVHPVTFLKYKPLRYRLICCAAAWMITLGSCLCCMFIMQLFYIYTCFFSLQFFIFIFIQLFCLVAVLRALKQSGPGEKTREKEENHMRRRAFVVILITTVTLISIYMPFIVTGLTYILTQRYYSQMFTFSSICSTLAGFVQPVLYLQRTGKLSLALAFHKLTFYYFRSIFPENL